MISPDLYSFRALWQCYRQCRRHKRTTTNALTFEVDAEANLLALQQELRTHTYRPGRSICFITDGPKPREVFAADFRDRVVHHLLVSHQERVFEPRFIHDSYACRTGKGTLAASDRLMTFLRQVTANGRRPAWALKLDVANFFPSVHKATLHEILTRPLHHPEILWLTRTVLFHDPTTHYRFQSRQRRSAGPESARYPVPPRKSLFGKNNERGLPIGNLTSQFWGNVYLNELDQFVKRRLKCRYYLRYVDDMVLLAQDSETLVRWCAAIKEFLQTQLKLQLRPEMMTPFPVRQGIDFVGWKTWWNRRVPRRRTLANLRVRLAVFERAIPRQFPSPSFRSPKGNVSSSDPHLRPLPSREREGNYPGGHEKLLPARQLRPTAVRPPLGSVVLRVDLRRQDHGRNVTQLQATLASSAGHMRHGAAWRGWEALWREYPWLMALFDRRGWQFHERWPQHRLARLRRFPAQYRGLVRDAGTQCLVFCQVGQFIEFYGPQRLLATQALGLRPASLPRAGYALTVGFPARLFGIYRARALRQGLAVLEVWQGPVVMTSHCRERLPSRLFLPVMDEFDRLRGRDHQ